jgi:hypothetical protein
MLKRILWALAPIVVSKVMQKRGAGQTGRGRTISRTDKTRFKKNFGK